MTTSAVGHTNVMLHLLTYKKPNSAQVINRVTSIINMEEVRGLKKHKSTSWYKAVMVMPGWHVILREQIYIALILVYWNFSSLYASLGNILLP